MFWQNTADFWKIQITPKSTLRRGLIIGGMDQRKVDFFEILKKELLFQDILKGDIASVLEKWAQFIDSLELEKKNDYQALALKQEQESEEKNETFWQDQLIHLAHSLNREHFKHLSQELKIKIWSGDHSALK